MTGDITSITLAGARVIENEAAALNPEEFTFMGTESVPPGAKVLGEATDEMKRLCTLFHKYMAKGELGETEIKKRLIHSLLGFEVGNTFEDAWGTPFGFTEDWVVYALD